MDNKFVIVTDSACDLSLSYAEEIGVKIMPLAVTLEGREPIYDTVADKKELYAELRAKKNAVTSAIN